MLSQTNLSHIPHQPGVYIFKNLKGQILYIGKAKNLHKRVQQYFAPGSVRKQDMMHKADGVEFVVVETEYDALMLEMNMIKQHLPPYNRLLKGDNSYVYIKITSEPRPQIFFTRTRMDDGAIYIGPKNKRANLSKLLQYLRQLLGYRGCKSTQFRQGKLCSDYLFGICKGRCVYAKLNQRNAETYLTPAVKFGFDADATFQSGRQKSRYMIQLIVDFFEGETSKILEHITKEINRCIESQNFEYAAKLRDIYHNMDEMTQKQSVIINPSIHGAYCMIQQIATHRVYTIITFQYGKLNDILRFKELISETSLEQIKLQFELEYCGENEDVSTKPSDGGSTLAQDIIQHKSRDLRQYHPSESEHEISTIALGDYPEDHLTIQGHARRFIDSFIISDSWQADSVMNDLLAQLQNRYQLRSYPYRIECMDISHLSGGRASGGLSCLVGGMPHKQRYRQYKIPKEIAGDDLASLTHLLVSRLKLDSNKLLSDDQIPDVLILDGGPLQLTILRKLCTKYPLMTQYMTKIQFCGLAKGSARSSGSKIFGAVEQLIVVDEQGSQTPHDLIYDPADQVIIKLRDEAHRFANRYRSKQMGMEFRD